MFAFKKVFANQDEDVNESAYKPLILRTSYFPSLMEAEGSSLLRYRGVTTAITRL